MGSKIWKSWSNLFELLDLTQVLKLGELAYDIIVITKRYCYDSIPKLNRKIQTLNRTIKTSIIIWKVKDSIVYTRFKVILSFKF